MNISRRTFLKAAGAGVLALSATPLFDKAAIARSLESVGAGQVGILIDTTRCVGCRACQLACKQKNGLPADAASLPANRTFPEALSDTTFTLIDFRRTGGTEAKPVFTTVKKQCMHCLEPACASACFVAALHKSEEGPVLYDANRCVGCRYCLMACPFSVPTFEWDKTFGHIQKCDLCPERTSQGEPTACAEACPVGTLTFGHRGELPAEAWRRINADRSYVRHVYGETEVGGTSVMYISDVPFEELGFRTSLPTDPLPTYTWEVTRILPPFAAGFTVTIMALFARRQKLVREREEAEANAAAGVEVKEEVAAR